MKPPESFVPLTAAPVSPAQREFRVTLLNGHTHTHANGTNGPASNNVNGNSPAKAAGFQSLESQPAVVGIGSDKRIGEPRVTLQRDGDRVTHLRIQCPCGQIIELACVYDPPTGGV